MSRDCRVSSKIGIAAVGRFGHRGVAEDTFIFGLISFASKMPGTKVCFSSPTELSDHSEQLLQSCDIEYLQIRVDNPAPPSSPSSSLLTQATQISKALDQLEDCQVVIKIRSDFAVIEPTLFISCLEAFMASGRTLGTLAVNSPVAPFMPMPWFLNDLIMFGAPVELKKFWSPLEINDLAVFDARCHFWDLSIFQAIGSPRATVEQVLWSRYFKGAAELSFFEPNFANLLESWKCTDSVFKFSAGGAGIRLTDNLRAGTKLASIYFWPNYGVIAEPLRPAIAKVAAWTYRVFFFLHPHWLFHRLVKLWDELKALGRW